MGQEPISESATLCCAAHAWRPQAPHYYDQIAWFTKGQAKRPALNLDCSAGGSFDLVPELQGSGTLLDLSWHISDHYPLWVEFAVPGP